MTARLSRSAGAVGQLWLSRRLARSVLGGVTAVLLVTGCSHPSRTPHDPSAAFFSPSTGLATATASPFATPIGNPTAPVAGPISRPDPRLTPGVVANSDGNAICSGPQHIHEHIANNEQASVYARYGLSFPQRSHAYALDYLIPLTLGGAAVPDNMWPATTAGIGFHQKQQLNQRLRILVCRGDISLATAQHQIAADWYALWQADAA